MEAIIIAELKLIQDGIAKLIDMLEVKQTPAAEPEAPAEEPQKEKAPNV